MAQAITTKLPTLSVTDSNSNNFESKKSIKTIQKLEHTQIKPQYFTSQDMSSKYIFSHDVEEEHRMMRLENEKLNAKLIQQHDKNSNFILINRSINKKYTDLKKQLRDFRPMMVKYK